MPASEQPDFDDEFEQAIAEWRERNKLREDEAVLLLVDLFRIHQRHWDELRRRELPSFELVRADISKLADSARIFQGLSATLLEALRKQPLSHLATRVPRIAAFLAALACLVAGYLIGRAWP